jgi:hypothetical protein
LAACFIACFIARKPAGVNRRAPVWFPRDASVRFVYQAEPNDSSVTAPFSIANQNDSDIDRGSLRRNEKAARA